MKKQGIFSSSADCALAKGSKEFSSSVDCALAKCSKSKDKGSKSKDRVFLFSRLRIAKCSKSKDKGSKSKESFPLQQITHWRKEAKAKTDKSRAWTVQF